MSVHGFLLTILCLPVHVNLGLPYLEKQKSGQWMATLHETKYMAFSSIFLTKSGRSNSALRERTSFETKEKEKKGVISKKKKRSPPVYLHLWSHFWAENDITSATKQMLTFFFFFLEIIPHVLIPQLIGADGCIP